MLSCDVRFASSNARFGLPETGLGIIPGALGSTLLADVIGQHHALRLGCTGERINANEAQRLGLVDELQDSPEAARARARELATLVASKAPRAVAAFKGAMLELGASPALDSRVVREAASYEAQVRNGDAALGRANFKRIVAGEAPDWPPRSAEIVEAKP